MKNNGNIYLPVIATVNEIRDMAPDIRLFTFRTSRPMPHKPGQFFMISVFGYGEVPISITSTAKEPLSLCIKKVGHVTEGIHQLRPGDKVGLRGPYGREFPFDLAKGRDVIVMAGGLGMIPLRPVIHEFYRNAQDYGKVSILYGCRKDDMLYHEEIDDWEKAGIDVIYGLRGKMIDGPDGCVRAPHHLSQVETDFSEATAYICGPHNMIDLSMRELEERGMPPARIVTSLEAHMKCGVGKCGHCYMGPKYICTDGPVFTMEELKRIKHI